MATMSDFQIGDKVRFGRSSGEQTLGEVVRKGSARLKVKQLESRGTMRPYPGGTIWTVPPSLCEKADGSVAAPVTPTVVPSGTVFPPPKGREHDDPSSFALKAKRIGLPADCFGKTIRFDNRARTPLKIVGISLNRPKYPVNVEGAQGGGYKLDVPTVLRLLGEAAKPAVACPFPVGSRVQYKSLFGKDVWITGKVVGHNPNGRPQVLSPEGVRTPDPKDTRLFTGKRTDDEVMADINACYNHLSPENLTCDGEASRGHVRSRYAELNRVLRDLFIEIGRTVSEDEAFRWWDQNFRRKSA